MKWYTLTEYVNEETGEIHDKIPHDHYVIKINHLPTAHGKTTSIKKIQKIIRPNKQTKLEFNGTTN